MRPVWDILCLSKLRTKHLLDTVSETTSCHTPLTFAFWVLGPAIDAIFHQSTINSMQWLNKCTEIHVGFFFFFTTRQHLSPFCVQHNGWLQGRSLYNHYYIFGVVEHHIFSLISHPDLILKLLKHICLFTLHVSLIFRSTNMISEINICSYCRSRQSFKFDCNQLNECLQHFGESSWLCWVVWYTPETSTVEKLVAFTLIALSYISLFWGHAHFNCQRLANAAETSDTVKNRLLKYN